MFGVSIAAAVAGRLVDAVGTPHAYACTVVAGVLTGAAAWVARPFLSPAVPTPAP